MSQGMRKLNNAWIASLLYLLIAIPVVSNANPLLEKTLFPNFQAIMAADFEPAMDAVLEQFNTNIDTILKANPSWANTIQPLEEAISNVTQVWNIISHLNAVQNTTEIRTAYSKLLPKVTSFYSNVMHHPGLYNAFASIKASPEYATLNKAQQAVINQMLLEFRLSGAELTADGKERFKQISIRLDDLRNKFSNNVLDATQNWQHVVAANDEIQLNGLPEATKNIAADKARAAGKSGWILTLDTPCLTAVTSYAKNRELRKTMYTAFSTVASDQDPDPARKKWDNGPLIIEILKLRQELAKLLGFNNFAEFSLADKEAPSTNTVMTFLNDLATKAKAPATKEFNKLQNYAQGHDKIDKIQPWDLAYYAEAYKQESYGVSQEEIRKYFPEEQVFQGLFNIVSLLYGLNIQEVKQASVWDSTVKLFMIKDRNGLIRGYFYTDLYARQTKRSGAWMSEYTSRMLRSDGTRQLPVSFIVTNFMPGLTGLLTHNDVVTLFHEFGHMLQHTLTLLDYPSISGVNGVAWDAIEVASQFMENWAWQLGVINDISKNISTGEDLPKRIYESLLAARNFDAGLKTIRQVEFALFDFRLYLNAKEDQTKSAMDILNEIRKQVAVVPALERDRFPNRFSHIFSGGYAAGYYGYKWAEVLACDAFAAFQENGLFNSKIGAKFMQTILERGGETGTLDLFIEFRGREPKIEPMLQQNGIA